MQPKFFEIEDAETGELFRVESPDPEATYDEAANYLSTLKEEELVQYKWNPIVEKPIAPEPKGRNQEIRTAPGNPPGIPFQFTQEEFDATKEDIWSGNTSVTRGTNEKKVLGGSDEYITTLLLDGVDFNEAKRRIAEVYPEISANLEGEENANWSQEAWDKWRYELRSNPVMLKNVLEGRTRAANPAFLLTGEKDAEAPDNVVDEFVTSANRSFERILNSGVGLRSWVASVWGDEEAAETWAEQYALNRLAIEVDNPTDVTTLGDAWEGGRLGMWSASVLGELLPDMATSIGAAGIGKLGGQMVAKKIVKDMVEEIAEKTGSRALAERLVASTIARIGQRSAISTTAAQSIADMTGRIMGETYSNTGELAPWTSATAGFAAGGLDTFLPAALITKMGGRSALNISFEKLRSRIGDAAFRGFFMEGGTEVLQEIIEQIPEALITGNLDLDSEMLAEAFFRGGFGGATVSSGTQLAIGLRDKSLQRKRLGRIEKFNIPTATDRRTKEYKQQLLGLQDEIVDHISDMTSDWATPPDIRVYDNFSKVEGLTNDSVGVYQGNGRLLLNAEGLIAYAAERNISLESAIEAVTFHEALGHYALDLKYGEQLDTVLRNFYDRGGTKFRGAVNAWMARNPKAYTDPNDAPASAQADMEQWRLTRSIEEVLAEMAETDGLIPPTLNDMVRDTAKTFAAQMGLKLKFSTREVRSILGMAQREMMDVRRDGVFKEEAEHVNKYIFGKRENPMDATAAQTETIRSRPGVNTRRMAKMLGPQLYGNPRNMAKVTLKEILQNSVDAVRSSLRSGDIQQGTISVRISRDERSVSFLDNGTGMSPEILGGKFLEIAGTGKEGDKNSGGFGIAKMLFLYANKNIQVITVRDGKVAELNTSGEQLFDALDDAESAPNVMVRPFTPEDRVLFPDEHGTFIRLTIPETAEVADGEQKIDPFPRWLDEEDSFSHSPMFANINLEYSIEGRSFTDSLPVGNKFPIEDYKQFVGVKFPWGTAKIYVTQQPTGQKYGKNMYILSNGLWQFSSTVAKDPKDIYSEPVPYTFYVDVIPSVRPDQPGYPFDFNRQGFTKDAQEDFNKVHKYINAVYAYKTLESGASSFASVNYIEPGSGTIGSPVELRYKAMESRTDITGAISDGDEVSINEDGVMTVNGTVVPDLDVSDLAAAVPSVDGLFVEDGLVSPNKIMVHENLMVEKRDDDGTFQPVPLIEFMRQKFGKRVDEYLDYVGGTFLDLRNEVVSVLGPDYLGMLNSAVGVSADWYNGVSIKVPFDGMYINPFTADSDNIVEAAYGMWGTMIHELAHYKIRNHYADFPKEMQKILYKLRANSLQALDAEEDFVQKLQTDFADIYEFSNQLFREGEPNYGSGEFRLRSVKEPFEGGQKEQLPDGIGEGQIDSDNEFGREGSARESVFSRNPESAEESVGNDGRDPNDWMATEGDGLTSAGFRRREPSASEIRAARKAFWEMKAKNSEEANTYDERYGNRHVKLSRVDPYTVTGSQIAESVDPFSLLQDIASEYPVTTLSVEEMQQAALDRNLSPSDVIRWAQVQPGQFSKRLFMYDLQAVKINERLQELEKKILAGDYSAETMAQYIAAAGTYQEMGKRIFGMQSELGRGLRMVREMATRRSNLENFQKALKEMGPEYEGLMDPETFRRFVTNLRNEVDQNTIATGDKVDAIAEYTLKLINVPRTLMSSYDLSAPLRQGIYFINKGEYWRAFAAMKEFAGPDGEIAYNQLMRDITSDPNYGYVQIGNPGFSNVEGSVGSREEIFQGSDIAAHIPILGKGVRMSEHAYSGFLNKLRADLFNSYLNKMFDLGLIRRIDDIMVEVEDEMTGEVTMEPDFNLLNEEERKLLRGIGDFIATGTGRANFGHSKLGKSLTAASALLNSVFFSARLIMSRVNLLANPAFYASLPGPLKMEAAKQGAIFFSLLGMVYSAIPMMVNGLFADEDEPIIETTWNVRSSDFLKFKVGNTRYDISGGFGPYMTFYTKAVRHGINRSELGFLPEDVNSLGENIYYGKGSYEPTFGDTVDRFIRSKYSPVMSFIRDAYEGENVVGQRFDTTETDIFKNPITSRLMPMYLSDLAEVAENDGLGMAAVSAPFGLLGIGIGSYAPAPIDPDKEQESPTRFAMKSAPNGENDMVRVEDGTVYLKPDAQRAWKMALNEFYSLEVDALMQDERVNWEGLSDKERREELKKARRRASKATKKYMLGDVLGMGDLELDEEDN